MSLTYSQAIGAMRDYFDTQWGSTTPIIWGSDDPTEKPNTTWVRFNIRHSDGFQATMGSPGSNRFDRVGVLTIQVFSPENQLGTDAVDKSTTILDLYSGLNDNGIEYYDAIVREIGNDGYGWYQINVVMTFRYEQIT